MSSVRTDWPWLGAPVASGLAGCASKGDVQLVQGEVALLKAETARRDSARAAQLDEVIRVQQQIMDSLTASREAGRRSSRATSRTDLYNIQQQLVQLQELTGQSQQRLSELRTQLEARGAQIEDGGPAAPGDTARPADSGAAAASADQMYEASLAQLRRGSTAHRPAGPARDASAVSRPASGPPDALYFIGQSFAAENPDSAAAYYAQVVDKYPTSARAGSALYNLGLLAERRKDTAKARDAYQRVVQKYPQSDEAALARDRLKALGR